MPTIDLTATGRRLREFRDDNGVTTRELMDIFGFNNPNAIYKWFRGEALPTVDNLVILADAFEVPIDDLLVIRRNTDTAVA